MKQYNFRVFSVFIGNLEQDVGKLKVWGKGGSGNRLWVILILVIVVIFILLLS